MIQLAMQYFPIHTGPTVSARQRTINELCPSARLHPLITVALQQLACTVMLNQCMNAVTMCVAGSRVVMK